MPNRTVTVRLAVDSSDAVKNLRKVGAEAKGAAGDIKGKFDNASPSLTKTGKAAGGLAGAIGAVGLAAPGLAVVGGAAIGAGIGLGKAVAKASTFEASMRQVGVQTGLSGTALEDMTALAIKMGGETSFSAQGASEAMLELAKGGMSAADQKAGALSETLTLATAGGLELGEAATYMTQGLNTFGLSAEDSGRVAASLAGAANASTASVSDLGTALSQVGPSAAQLGFSIEDTTAALAALTNNGVKGSDAGTSLKTMFTRLQPATKKTEQAFRELGLETAAGGNAFFDAEGNVKSMAEVAGVLQNALKGQTREQKAATLSTLFGSDAQRAGIILAEEGAAGIAKYAEATNDSQAAQDLAKSATEGFSGALERFQGSIETAQIQLGTKFLPILTTALDYLGGPGMETLSSAAGILRDTFAPQLAATTGGIQTFFDYLSTHQADVLRTFKGWGNGIFDFAVAVAEMAAGGLRNLGDFAVKGTDAVLGMVGALLQAFDDIPFVDMSDSIASFENTKLSARKMSGDIRADLYQVADDIDTKVVPGVENMRGRFNDAANTAIVSADQRDALQKMGQSFKEVNALVGSGKGQIDTYKEATAALSKTTSELSTGLGSAKTAFEKQYKAAKDSGAKQEDLNKITKDYKDQLIDTLEQMTGNREEAVKLAEKYGLMPSEVITTAEFKYKTAQESAKAYKEYVNEQQKKHKVLSEAEWATKKARGDVRSYKEYISDEQKKHKVLSKAEWDAKFARETARKYREYVNEQQAKHKVLSEAKWDATKARTDTRTYREYVNEQKGKQNLLSKPQWDAANARENARKFREYVNLQTDKINDEDVGIKLNLSSNYAKVKKEFDLKFPQSRAMGGPVQNLSGRGEQKYDTEPAMLRVNEHVWTPEEVRAAGGHEAMFNMRRAALNGELGGYATGGAVGIRPKVYPSKMPQLLDPDDMGERVAKYMGKAAQPSLQKMVDAYLKAAEAAAGDYGMASPGKYGNSRFNAEQLKNAATIASVGSSMGSKAVLIGLMTAMQESTLRNLAGGDRDSVGLFQQRAPWGPVSARRDPRTSAYMFFHGGKGGQRGLDDIKGWKGMAPGVAAQRVQVSAFPSAYSKWADEAQDIINSSGSGAITGKNTGPFLGGQKPVAGSGNRHRNGYGWAQWAGDFPIGLGTPVHAWNAGRITSVRSLTTSYGKHIRMAHADGVNTLYAHLSRFNVKAGQTVGKGQVLAGSGSTGKSTGPHVHFEKYDQGGQLKPGVTMVVNGTKKPEHVITDARWQQIIGARSQPARIDSADMARLVDAITRQVPAQLTINNPVREPSSRSIATASNYASR